MATGIFFVTLEDLKQQANKFELRAKDRTKFPKEWRKIQDAKLEKESFEMKENQKRLESEAEQKRLELEAEQKRLESEERRMKKEREMEKKRFNRETKLLSEKLAAQLMLERAK